MGQTRWASREMHSVLGYDALRLAGAAYLAWLAWNAVKPGGASPFEVSLFIVSSSHGVFAQQKPIVVTPLMTTSETSSGQPITLPQKEVQVTVSTYDIQPGAVLPWHEHPYARYAYVLAGTLSVTNAVTGQTAILRKGEPFHRHTLRSPLLPRPS